MIWLVLPVTLLALANKTGPLFGLLRPAIRNPQSAAAFVDLGYVAGFLLGLVGLVLLALVLLYLPFLQVHFAAEGRFRAFFAIRTVRQRFRRATWMFAFAFFLTLLFALPLYLL